MAVINESNAYPISANILTIFNLNKCIYKNLINKNKAVIWKSFIYTY